MNSEILKPFQSVKRGNLLEGGNKMTKAAKRSSVRRLFVERMKREGRGKEWSTVIKQVMKDTGKRYSQAIWEAMRKMGYMGPEKEHQLHAEFQANGQKTKLQRQIDEERQQIREELMTENFEQAVNALPDKAPITVEIDWIIAHPAMARWVRNSDKTENILITPEDILFPPHGPAPSKAAVVALQHWVNFPQQFFKEILDEQIKHSANVRTRQDEQDNDAMEEIEKLLKQIGSGSWGTYSPSTD